MIRVIARKELISLARDGRFRLGAAIALLLLVAALASGLARARALAAEREAAVEANRRQWVEQGEKNPHGAAHFGVHAFKPVSPLSFVDPGLSAYLGTSSWLEAHYQNPFQHRPADDAAALGRVGELSAASLLQRVVPLLIVLLAFGSVAGERDRGTLRMLLGQGVRGRDLLLGKLLGAAAALSLTLVPAAAIGVAALALTGDLAANAPRLALLALANLLYLAAFLGLAVAVSARAPSARAALARLLGLWIVICFIAPRAAAELGARLHPPPTPVAFWQAVRHDLKEGIDGHGAPDARRAALEREVLARYGASRVEDLPINFSGLLLQAGEEHGNAVFDRHYGRLWDTFEREARVHEMLAALSPALAVSRVSMGLAGTDLGEQRRFADAAEAHRRLLNRMMNEDLTQRSRTGDFRYTASRALWERVPDLRYQPPGLAAAVRPHLGSALALVAWAALALAAVLAAGRRLAP
ncbi:DUF3526 domain-containing protein [Sorangium cellulosum]|uniref:ABC transporter permease n=1 Tax=Sorangium cellulosum So0157-2 TaxID=1254432 RepID=S4XQ12_SORCE|nr:DUF3526 domain-containing protein [Sorangium cellulosum]AGP34491.1 hypothetical protein SCE1572_08215 [Sorangium cellulosum So0157-2]